MFYTVFTNSYKLWNDKNKIQNKFPLSADRDSVSYLLPHMLVFSPCHYVMRGNRPTDKGLIRLALNTYLLNPPFTFIKPWKTNEFKHRFPVSPPDIKARVHLCSTLNKQMCLVSQHKYSLTVFGNVRFIILVCFITTFSTLSHHQTTNRSIRTITLHFFNLN